MHALLIVNPVAGHGISRERALKLKNALNTDDFNVFFQNVTMIKNLGAAESGGKDKVMTVTFRYTTDRSADTLTVYSGSDSSKYIMEYNGNTIGTVSKSYISSLIEGADNLIAGKAVAGL